MGEWVWGLSGVDQGEGVGGWGGGGRVKLVWVGEERNTANTNASCLFTQCGEAIELTLGQTFHWNSKASNEQPLTFSVAVNLGKHNLARLLKQQTRKHVQCAHSPLNNYINQTNKPFRVLFFSMRCGVREEKWRLKRGPLCFFKLNCCYKA